MEDSQKEELIRKRQPFNFGIKELKRVLSRMDMPKAEKNRTIRMYKERLYTRVDEVKAKMEAKGLTPLSERSLKDAITAGDDTDATDK